MNPSQAYNPPFVCVTTSLEEKKIVPKFISTSKNTYKILGEQSALSSLIADLGHLCSSLLVKEET